MSSVDHYVPKLSEPGKRWVRFALVIAGAAAAWWILLALRGVLTPIAVSGAIAYILNPVVTALEKRWRVSRIASVLLGVGALLVVTAWLLVFSAIQVQTLAENIPSYVRAANAYMAGSFTFGFDQPTSSPSTLPTSAPAAGLGGALMSSRTMQSLSDFAGEHGAVLAKGLEATVPSILGALTTLTSALTLMVLIPTYTVFLLFYFNDIVAAVRSHLPARSRETVVEVVSTVDRAMANFFRGRIMVCFFVGLLSSVGWQFTNVQYNFLLGLLAGLLNLVPFVSIVVAPLAALDAYMNTPAGESWVPFVIATFGVYAVVQMIESLILSPTIEARTSGLHPLTTIVALLVGAEVAGLLGMLLSIPIASTLKSLGSRFVLPEIRRLASEPQPASESPETPASDPPATNDSTSDAASPDGKSDDG